MTKFPQLEVSVSLDSRERRRQPRLEIMCNSLKTVNSIFTTLSTS